MTVSHNEHNSANSSETKPVTNPVTNSALLEQLDVLTPTSVPNGTPLIVRRDAISQAMDGNLTLQDRERIKGEIVALYREAEAAAAAYAELKDSVKALAARWKHSDPPSGAAPGRSSTHSSSTGRVDHLGASTFIEKGWSLLSTGDAVAAEQSFKRALELAPNSSEAESLLGWAQMMQENYDSALLTYHNVLLREPHNALARTNVGYICLRKKIYGEAIEHLSRAIRLDVDKKATLYAHLYLGQVYYEREMYDDADLFFRKAIDLGPNLLQAWYELGRSQWFAGNQDEAKESWRAGAAANKFNPWGKRCAELLESIEQGEVPPR
jgi:tetratricopeptide (TPR) repeat protein